MCVILGPVKSGTTLLISLLDGHPELAAFPLEVKFLAHWFERFAKLDQQTTYEELNDFFFQSSKIQLMNPDVSRAADIMNSGRIDFSGFNFTDLYLAQKRNELVATDGALSGDKLIRSFIFDIHNALMEVLGKKLFRRVVVKEGNHGAPYIRKIRRLFGNVRFIVVQRDPRDIFVSLKTIAEQKRLGVVSPSFKDFISPAEFVVGNPKKNITAFANVFSEFSQDDGFLFIKYESLVTDPARQTEVISKFLDIDPHSSLYFPSNLGSTWGGNSSEMGEFEGISGKRRDKWKGSLRKSEIRILEYAFMRYMKQGGYQLSGQRLGPFRFIVDVLWTQAGAIAKTWSWSMIGIKAMVKQGLVTVHVIIEVLLVKLHRNTQD